MTLFDEHPEPDKTEKQIKWLKLGWWLEDHSVRVFLLIFLFVILMTCAGC